MKLRRLRNAFLLLVKYTLNPVTRALARSSFGPFSLIRHVGRRSGKIYETPIIVAPFEDGFAVELTYGEDVDWHKNVVAAGSCTVIWHGREYAIDKIERLTAEVGRAAFAPSQQVILRLLRRKRFEKLHVRR